MQTVDAFLNRDGNRDWNWEEDFTNKGKRETDFLRPEHGPVVHIAEMYDYRIAHITLDDRTGDCTHRAGVSRVRFVQVPRVYLASSGIVQASLWSCFCGGLYRLRISASTTSLPLRKGLFIVTGCDAPVGDCNVKFTGSGPGVAPTVSTSLIVWPVMRSMPPGCDLFGHWSQGRFSSWIQYSMVAIILLLSSLWLGIPPRPS